MTSSAKNGDNIVPVPRSTPNSSPRWAVVATVKAPLVDIAGFAAHHLSLGAARVTLYLDDPHNSNISPDINADIAFLQSHDKIDVIPCDAAWYADQKWPRHNTHQRRQMFNATHAYRRLDADWLAHIDVDEFVLPAIQIEKILANVPSTDALVQMPSAELLAPHPPDTTPRFFKLTPRQANQPSTVREDIYPTYGLHLRGGYISHIDGKIFVRRGLENVTIGIHSLLYQGVAATNAHIQNTLRLGHAHAPSLEIFQKHLSFRLSHGSYRKRDNTDFRLADIIDYLRETEGETGLQHLFNEVSAATPTLVAALRQHNMLIEHPLDLDRKIMDIFGRLPPSGKENNGQ
ncbi:MAG: glycosyltransferase family 2 protein [Rhodobacterales bacterium]|nr:glycosyltransferase family 2 protein [Rhodobacterales bacterium]